MENSLFKRPWTCDRTDYVMMMFIVVFVVVVVVVTVVVVVVVELNVQRVLQMKNVAWSLQCCSQKEGKQETDEKEQDRRKGKKRRGERKRQKRNLLSKLLTCYTTDVRLLTNTSSVRPVTVVS